MILQHSQSRALLKQYIAAFAASFSVLASGSCGGWFTPILTHLMSPTSEIPLTTAQATCAVSIVELGNLLSPLPAGILCNYIGRKPVILICGPIYIISWLMILYFPTAMMLIIARVIQGLAMGLVFTVVPIYLGEIASDSSRGAITSIFFNSWWAGYLIEYALGPFLSFTTFTYITLSLNIPFILLFFWQPESPYYYLMVGNEAKALKSLEWFRETSHEKLKDEMDKIILSMEETNKSVSLKDLLATSADRRAIVLLMALTAVRLFSGIGTITIYATQIFEMTPNLSVSSDAVTIALGVIMFVGGCISSFTLDSFGRRPLLMISCLGSLLCEFCAGTYYFLLFKTSIKVSQFSWIAPVFILVYSGVCTAGMYPVCSAYTSELFNTNVRGIASSIGAINVTIVSFIMLLSYQPVIDIWGLYANFYIYSIVILIGSVYFYFFAPETKGKSFSQIRKDLSK